MVSSVRWAGVIHSGDAGSATGEGAMNEGQAMATDMTVSTHHIATRHESTELSVDDVLKRMGSVQDLMKRAMTLNVDYGTIPGTKSKPTLLKPGAEKLCVMFRLAPKYRTTKTFHDDGHLTVESTCQIYDNGENFCGEASAMCSTREAKYAYRKSERVCPSCGKAGIIKGKAEFGGGWLCWKKKDGCGQQFGDNDPAITSQAAGRVPNEDLGDSYNTVLRVAEKRALIGAVRLVTGSSALFDEETPAVNERDLEPENPHYVPPPKPKPRVDEPDAAVVKHWQDIMASEPTLDAINDSLSAIKGIEHKPTRVRVWNMIVDTLKPHGIVFDEKVVKFTFIAPNNETFGADSALEPETV